MNKIINPNLYDDLLSSSINNYQSLGFSSDLHVNYVGLIKEVSARIELIAIFNLGLEP